MTLRLLWQGTIPKPRVSSCSMPGHWSLCTLCRCPLGVGHGGKTLALLLTDAFIQKYLYALAISQTFYWPLRMERWVRQVCPGWWWQTIHTRATLGTWQSLSTLPPLCPHATINPWVSWIWPSKHLSCSSLLLHPSQESPSLGSSYLSCWLLEFPLSQSVWSGLILPQHSPTLFLEWFA